MPLNIKRTKYFQTEIYTQKVSLKRKVKEYLSNIHKMREIMTNRKCLFHALQEMLKAVSNTRKMISDGNMNLQNE